MTFGEDLGWGSSVEESQRIIDRFVELGGNFIRAPIARFSP
jgi:aryl-alcohol dehydrogenase-like predicted oxidoreductase